MVRTSTGPAEKSAKTPGVDAGEKLPADKESKAIHKNADLDDATWGQIEAMARSQNATPAEVIKRAITAQYGEPAPDGAYHSGTETLDKP